MITKTEQPQSTQNCSIASILIKKGTWVLDFYSTPFESRNGNSEFQILSICPFVCLSVCPSVRPSVIISYYFPYSHPKLTQPPPFDLSHATSPTPVSNVPQPCLPCPPVKWSPNEQDHITDLSFSTGVTGVICQLVRKIDEKVLLLLLHKQENRQKLFSR